VTARAWLLALGAGLLVVAVVVVLVVGRDGSDTPVPEAGDVVSSEAADRFLADYVDDDGRVVRRDEGDDTVSEGQAYALLLAVATGDEDRFAQVWEWTKKQLQRDDGLFAWRWADGAVADESPAADADLDIAAALAVAADRFDRPEWRDEARRVAVAVGRHETASVGSRRVVVAGPWAVGDRIVNPSYLARCDWAVLADVTDDEGWQQLGDDADALLRDLARDGLPPDWVRLSSDGDPTPIDSPSGGGSGRWGLDAARIPVRLAACSEGASLAEDLWPRLRDLEGDGSGLAYSLDGEAVDTTEHPLGLVAAAAAAHAAGDRDSATRLLGLADDLGRQVPTYYGSAWLAFGDIVLRSDAPLAAPIAWRAPVQEQPTTTAEPSTTEPPTTSSPTTAPTSESTSTTEPSSETTSTTSDSTSGSSTTTPGSTTTTTPSSTGDLSSSRDQQLPFAAEDADRGGPAERSRRTTGAVALGGLGAALVLGSVLGLRERRLTRRDQAAESG